MENLLDALTKLFETDFATVKKVGDHQLVSYNADADVVIGLCNELLINADGSCNLDNINHIRQHGYQVYPGDTDSFGWLTWVIAKNGKELVFG